MKVVCFYIIWCVLLGMIQTQIFSFVYAEQQFEGYENIVSFRLFSGEQQNPSILKYLNDRYALLPDVSVLFFVCLR